MEQPRKGYIAPKIMRVVLRKEQAILSQCTTAWTSNTAGSTKWCRTRNGCRRASGSAGADSTGSPS